MLTTLQYLLLENESTQKPYQCMLRLPAALFAMNVVASSLKAIVHAWLKPFQEFRNIMLICPLIKQLYSISLQVHSPIYHVFILYSLGSMNLYKFYHILVV